ncbi:MAG: hypothetical protein Q9180_001070 [Flavoplaca navasiana]
MNSVIKANTVKFAEDVKGGSIDLTFSIQTRNKLPKRKPRGRPPKAPPANTPADAEVKVQLPAQAEDTNIQPEAPEAQHPSGSSRTQTAERHHLPLQLKQRHTSSCMWRYRSGRESDTDDDDENSRRNKISKANMALILALAAVMDNGDGDNEEVAWAMACSDIQDQPNAIPTSMTYRQAINDPIWGKERKKAIAAEIIALMSNGT